MFTTPTTSVTPASAPSAVRGISPATADPAFPAEPKVPAQAAPAPDPAPPKPAPGSQLKLVVARAEQSLAYSYTLIDQVTGRVVAEIPHHAAETAVGDPNYTAGGVVDTHA